MIDLSLKNSRPFKVLETDEVLESTLTEFLNFKLQSLKILLANSSFSFQALCVRH